MVDVPLGVNDCESFSLGSSRSSTYHPTIWKQVRDRLLSGGAILLLLAWLVCAAGIVTRVVSVTGLEVRRKGAIGLALLVYLVPIGVVVALDEFVIRRIRYGLPAPARHKRGTLDPDQVHTLDQRLTGQNDSTLPKPSLRRTSSPAAIRAIQALFETATKALRWTGFASSRLPHSRALA